VAAWDVSAGSLKPYTPAPGPDYLHLAAGAGGLLYAVGPGLYGGAGTVWACAINPSEWAVTALPRIAVGSTDYFRPLAAYSLASDGSNLVHVVVGNGYRYAWSGTSWMGYAEPLARHDGNAQATWQGAYIAGHNRAYAGNARTTAGQSSLGKCSHSLYVPLCAAGMGTSLYVVDRPYGAGDAWSWWLIELPTHPYQPGYIPMPGAPQTLTVTVVDDDATVHWQFQDPDAPDDDQSAYRVVIETDAGVQVTDTGKVASSTSRYTENDLADGGYRARVWVWDETDQMSAEGKTSFVVGGAPVGDDPPTATITAPLNEATITGDTDVTVDADDDVGVVSVAVYIDGTLLGALTAPNDGEDYTLRWEVAGWSDGQHTIIAVATDTAGQTGSHSIVVDLDVGGDTEDPVVVINAPAAGTQVGETVTVDATCTDNVAVVEVRLYVDGQAQASLEKANAGANRYTFAWNPAGWANGSHTVRVVAYDPAGNWGHAEVAVVVDRNLADATRYLFTEQMPVAAVEHLWRDDVVWRRGLLTCIPRQELPEDPRERYQVTVGVHVPGDSVNFADYQRIRPDEVHGFRMEGNTARWALCAQPSFVESYWELDATAAFRLIPLPSGGPAVLATGDNGLWHLVGGDYVLWEALTGMTSLADGAYYNGQIACVGGTAFVLKDTDTGELTWQAMLPGATGYTAVAADEGYMLVAVTTAGGAAVYRFAYDALTRVGELASAVNRLALRNGVGAVGCADGTVHRWAGGSAGLELLVDTESDGVWSIHQADTITYVGTGDLGAVWRSSPEWTEDTKLGAGRVRALALWRNALYAAGLGDGTLWRMQNGVWSAWHVFDGVTVIDDLYVDADKRLWVAATHSGGARVYRLEVAEAGDFESGTEPPDLIARIVRAVPVAQA